MVSHTAPPADEATSRTAVAAAPAPSERHADSLLQCGIQELHGAMA